MEYKMIKDNMQCVRKLINMKTINKYWAYVNVNLCIYSFFPFFSVPNRFTYFIVYGCIKKWKYRKMSFLMFNSASLL